MRITTWNLNGIRAVWSHVMPFAQDDISADVICFQETKLQKPDPNLILPGYWGFFSCAYNRRSYSGTAIYTRMIPLRISFSMSTEASAFIEIKRKKNAEHSVEISLQHQEAQNEWEGRIMTADYPNLFIVNAYFPNPLRNQKRLAFRKKWDDEFYPYIEELNKIKPTIVCGDFNLVARKIDSHTQVQKAMVENAALMSRERSYFFHATDAHFVDAYRVARPDETDCYTWWSNRINARKENRGARLDYILVPKEYKEYIQDCMNLYQTHGSDHCPLRLKIDIPFKEYKNVNLMNARQSIRKAKKGKSDYYMDLDIVWMSINWEAAETIVYKMQVGISHAAERNDDAKVLELEDQLMDSIYAKLLAVRHVADSAPGLDHIEWKTAKDKMRAALSLERKGYKAYPYRSFEMKSRYGKVRHFGVATHYDRAMQTLMAMALDPVAEARGDEHSFAFRKGRCALDAAEYLRSFLQDGCNGYPPCDWILKIDVRQFYASISHEWMRKHIPLDENLIDEILEQGYVLDGELFPPKNSGVVAGMELSPIIGNMTLDHMQNYVYKGLHRGDANVDYDNGRLIRYADDVIIMARNKRTAYQILDSVKRFLANRGLKLHPDKTEVCFVRDGFTYMKRWYKKVGETVIIKPTEIAVETFMRNLQETVHDPLITQEELIPKLNKKLIGWANYHRIEDCTEAYAEIDSFLRAELLKRCEILHPKWTVGRIKRKYFYPDEKGRWVYCLPHDQSTKVVFLSDIHPAVHQRIPVHYNPYNPESPSLKKIQTERTINNVTGKYGAIMKRQEGRCVICGQPILVDQEKELAPYRLEAGGQIYNAYVHSRCANSAAESVMVEELPVSPFQAAYELRTLAGNKIGKKAQYYPLIEFFRSQKENTVTLTFKQMRDMMGGLPPRAKYKTFWTSSGEGKISTLWLENGFEVSELDLEGERVTFQRVHSRYSRIQMPEWVYRNTLPDIVCDEVERYLKYIEKKYGLK